jgi:tetratricopeptide (TPR) repeat protein
VALFVERAIAATDSFRLTDENARTVARLCQRLDGIALAIELAAPRLKALSLEQLDAKLSERFRILTGGSRTALPRQQTMRALVDWSYELLTDDEKALFRRVAVFGGGWSLDAACAICSDEKIEEWAVLDLLESLVDKSMVVAKLSGSEQRYRLLESTRQYAQELLEKSGELEPMRVRHLAWYLDFANRAESVRQSAPTKTWFALVGLESDNFRAALDWSLGEKRDIERGAALASKLYSFWVAGAYEAEGRKRLEAALALSGELASKETVAALWLGRLRLSGTALAWAQHQEIAERALELHSELGDERGIVYSKTAIAESYLRRFRHAEAQTRLDEALVAAERVGDRNLIGGVKSAMARNFNFAGKNAEARVLYAEALGIARATGNDRMRATIVGNLAEIAFQEGDVPRAIELGRENVVDTVARYIALNNLAAYLLAVDRLEEARELARKALRLARDAQFAGHVGISIQHLAGVAVKGEPTLAARLLGYCNATFKRHGFSLEYTEKYGNDKLTEMLNSMLEEREFAQLLVEGAALTEDQAVEEALRI